MSAPGQARGTLEHAGQILARDFGEFIVSKQKMKKAEGICLVREKREAGCQTLGFTARPFVLCGLPIRRPPADQLLFERRNGHFTLQITGHPQFGLPFGQDRLVPIFLATMAVRTYQLTQRERIALGLLAQHDALTAREFTELLELTTAEMLQPWIKRLLHWGLVQSAGRPKSTRYFIDPRLLLDLNFVGDTTLKRIEPHRHSALLVEEDVGRFPKSKIGGIHQRVGSEIPRSRVRRAIEHLVKERKLVPVGVRSGTRYLLA